MTEIVPFTVFYKADEPHQDYYTRNPTAGYCLFVIRPKLDKFRKVFKAKLNERGDLRRANSRRGTLSEEQQAIFDEITDKMKGMPLWDKADEAEAP